MEAPKLSSTALTVLIVGGVILILYEKIFGKSEEDKANDARNTAKEDETKDAVTELEDKGLKPTWQDYQYRAYADQLYTAMSGMGTDELAVSKVFEHILNDLDFAKLDLAFGSRDGENMEQWLTSELSSYWTTQINNMLKKNGVRARV